MQKLGFIGLGIMGGPMAGHLQAAGHKLYLHDVKNPPANLVENGATVCTSAMEVAKRADIIFLMVPDTPQVEEVLFSENGIAAGLSAGPPDRNSSRRNWAAPSFKRAVAPSRK